MTERAVGAGRIAVRAMAPGEVDAVAALEAEALGHTLAREALAAEVARSWARVLVATDDAGSVVGFVNFWLVADEVHVLNLATVPARRRQGIGRALMDAVLAVARAQRAETVLLEVRPSNAAAVALYRALGFAVTTTRARYYEDGEDALVMTLAVG